MKLVHVAVAALLGWILLVPPCVDAPDGSSLIAPNGSCVQDLNAPLGKWVSEGYFEDAELCQAQIKLAKEAWAGTPSLASDYECVWETDPRLAK